MSLPPLSFSLFCFQANFSPIFLFSDFATFPLLPLSLFLLLPIYYFFSSFFLCSPKSLYFPSHTSQLLFSFLYKQLHPKPSKPTTSSSSSSLFVYFTSLSEEKENMEIDFRTSRVHSANHITAMQAARLNSENQLCLDDSQGEDDTRASFPCPFCYVDIELPVLSSHLQQEHCFDTKNAVCPICAANLGKDMIGHFMLQHTQLLKRKRKGQRSGLWTNSPSTLSKELQGLASFLGVTSAKGGSDTLNPTANPLLSPFLCNAAPEAKVNLDTCSKVASTKVDVTSCESCSMSDEDREEEYKERSQRVEFFQQMVLSTIFEDS